MYPFQSQNQIQTIKDKQFIRISKSAWIVLVTAYCKRTACSLLDGGLYDRSDESKISKNDEMG